MITHEEKLERISKWIEEIPELKNGYEDDEARKRDQLLNDIWQLINEL